MARAGLSLDLGADLEKVKKHKEKEKEKKPEPSIKKDGIESTRSSSATVVHCSKMTHQFIDSGPVMTLALLASFLQR